MTKGQSSGQGMNSFSVYGGLINLRKNPPTSVKPRIRAVKMLVATRGLFLKIGPLRYRIEKPGAIVGMVCDLASLATYDKNGRMRLGPSVLNMWYRMAKYQNKNLWITPKQKDAIINAHKACFSGEDINNPTTEEPK